MKRWLVIGALAVALAGCGPEEGVPFNPNAAEGGADEGERDEGSGKPAEE